MINYVRHGVGAVRPYLFGHVDIIEFVKTVFDAEELERFQFGDKEEYHVEMKIGDSVVVLEAGGDNQNAERACVYVYVPDVDATYQKALAAGATSVDAPSDKTYQERAAGVKDTFGNIWYIATNTASV
jgi:PhnB protein